MSAVINNSGIVAGCIYRIALENFVTYKRVVLYPGPSLNIIIGPNGTGKSTIVCAIILGLSEKPNVIGRAKKLSDYVRHGCENATIEIELYRNHGERNVVITRNFTTANTSTWHIDHKSATLRQVQELVVSMNIQVENLCQLLPQDRVQDFSKMNPQELLRSTLSAVEGHESVNQLDELINCRKQHRDNSDRSRNNEQFIQEQQRLNDRLKVKIDAMVERKKIEKQIGICEKKKLWLQYKELWEKTRDCLRQKKVADEEVKTYETQLSPLEHEITDAKRNISRTEQEKLAARKSFYESKNTVDRTLDAIRVQDLKLKEAESSYQDILKINEESKRELQEAKAKLEKLIVDKRRLDEQREDDATIKMNLANIENSISKTNAVIKRLEKEKLDVVLKLRSVEPQVAMCRNRINELEDVNVERLKTLRVYSEDCYKAVLWLRENRHLFKNNVYEPMMLEIQFTDPDFARYLESTVANRDLLAFTFECRQDMNLFLQKVRKENGLRRVNALCSQGGTGQYNSGDIQQLSYLGFHKYLVDTIMAPEAIVNYLCKNYQIHKIPIGNDHTYNNSKRVPDYIRCFYTTNHKFVTRVSTYSGEKSSSIIEIRPAKVLANTVDIEQVTALKRELSKQEKEVKIYNDDINKKNNQLSLLKKQWDSFNETRKSITDELNKLKLLSTQIKLQEKKVRDLETQPMFNIEDERERCKKKRRECVIKQCKLQVDMCAAVKTLHEKSHSVNILTYKLDFSRQWVLDKESALRGLREQLRNAKIKRENTERVYANTISQAKEKLEEAKKSTNNKVYQKDNDFPYKKEFKELPEDLTSLQDHCYELQTRMGSMDPGDERDIRDYEERKKAIARMRTEAENSDVENKELERRIEIIKRKWLPAVEELLQCINKNFGLMFKKLGGAGEIKLETGGNADDFDKYGISILVKFRESEELQQLTRHTQSGGERAVSTALYLMALQRLTTVPFRCVDEINQGMDAINERKMLELLFEVTTESDNAQYFLLTPKLLTNLPYSDKAVVHTIMNGQKLMSYSKWQHNKFLECARAYRNATLIL